MTLLCVAALGDVPGIRPCAEWDEHRITCRDHPGFTDRPGACDGCLPAAAERGFLCAHHFEQVETTLDAWPTWRRLIIEMEGRAQGTAEGGGGQPLGYIGLPATMLEMDAIERHLSTWDGGRAELWVSTEDGARAGLLFAQAARRTADRLNLDGLPDRFERVRCPTCGLLSLQENPTREVGGVTVVECQHCGARLARIRADHPRDARADACRDGRHVECAHTTCACACHEAGPMSHAQGIPALCDADLASQGFIDRAGWVIHADGTVHEATP